MSFMNLKESLKKNGDRKVNVIEPNIDEEKIDYVRDEIDILFEKHKLSNIEVLSLISSCFLQMLVYSPYKEKEIDNILIGIKKECLEFRQQIKDEEAKKDGN